MALLGKRVPPSLKVFVSALAVADDLGAIIIIALFYSSTLHYQAFLYAGLILALLLGLNRGRIYSRTPYFILGIFLWYFVHESGLHATLAGILLAAIIPARKEANVEDIAAQASAILRHELQRNRKSSSQKISTVSLANLVGALERLRDPGAHVESGLQHWSNYVILPLFAFFNTGILLVGLPYAIAEKQNLGVMLGLAAGKPIGIFLLSYLSVKTGLVRLSNELRWLHILGAGCLAGVGFTMSIFIANAAFEGNTLNSVKLSILIASVSAALLGMALLYAASEKRRNVKGKRQCVEAA
jgi:NhaA family Na+:H+ antiporter